MDVVIKRARCTLRVARLILTTSPEIDQRAEIIYRSCVIFFFFSSRRRHTRFDCDWSSDVCSSDLTAAGFQALDNNLGDSNTAVGANALLNNRRGTNNIALGSSAGTNLTTGNYNIEDRKSTRLNSSHSQISYAVFCLKKKTQTQHMT